MKGLLFGLIVGAIVVGGFGLTPALNAGGIKERAGVLFQELYQEADGSLRPTADDGQDFLPSYLDPTSKEYESQFRREQGLFAQHVTMTAFTEEIRQIMNEGREKKAQEDAERERTERQIATIKANTASLKYQLAGMKCRNQRAVREVLFQGPC